MKAIIILIILVELLFNISILYKYPIFGETTNYEDTEVLQGVAVVNIILLVIIGLLFIFT